MRVKFDKVFAENHIRQSNIHGKPHSRTSIDKEGRLNDDSASSTLPKVIREPLISPLRWASHKLRRKDGCESTIEVVIATHAVTLLFFGSPCYSECRKMAHTLRALEYVPEVVYVPVYTYQEQALQVEHDFYDNHGDWWMMGFQTLGAVEAVYMCGVSVLPTLVVVNYKGHVVSSYGQLDFAKWGDGAVVTWS